MSIGSEMVPSYLKVSWTHSRGLNNMKEKEKVLCTLQILSSPGS